MKRKLLNRSLFFLFMSLFVILFQFDDRKIFAKPMDELPIVLNEGTENQFELPFDADELFENKLKLDDTYQGFVQNNVSTISMKKLENGSESVPTTIFSSEISNKITYTFVTGFGNVISLMEFTTYPYGSTYVSINATKIVLQSANGEVLDTKWVYSEPPSNSQNSGAKSVYYNSLYQVDDNRFTAVYSTPQSTINTTTYLDANGKIEILPADNNRKIDLTSVSSQNQSIQEHNKMFDQSILSTGVMYSNALAKDYYVGVSYKNGVLLDKWKMEAEPSLDKVLMTPRTHFAGLAKNSLSFVDVKNSFGIEFMMTSTGQYQIISHWEMDVNKKVGKRTELKKFRDASITFQEEISNETELYYQVVNRNPNGAEKSAELWKLDAKKKNLN